MDETQSVSSYWGYAQGFVDLLGEYLRGAIKPVDITGRLEMRMSR